METVGETINKNNRPFVLAHMRQTLVRWWTTIITIGVTDAMSLWDRKRIRLLNGICAMGFLVLLILCFVYIGPQYRLTFFECLQGVAAYAFIIFLNYKQKHNLACHFFCLYNMASYSFMAVSHGQVDAAEYILMANSISSLLFFRRSRTIFLYFLLNVAAFFACKYSFAVMKPFLFMAGGENFYVTNHLILFIISFLIVYYFKAENDRQERLLKNKNESLALEKEKSDQLLMNILPYETAEELKATGSARAKHFELVTVLFTDFKNFTAISEQLAPAELVAQIHYCFSAFDNITGRYGIEKIKTIGDAYMCAGGLPVPDATNPVAVVSAALDIHAFMERYKEEQQAAGKPYFDIRIGVHSGPVVAGIVGTKKFAYDIWGDTVNIAMHMESSGTVEKVNISAATYRLVKDRFRCTYHDLIDAGNNEKIEMFFVEPLAVEKELV